MQNIEPQPVRTAIVPVRALRKLADDADKGDKDARALLNMIGRWWHQAHEVMDRDGDNLCSCCRVVLNENKVGGFGVMLTADKGRDSFGLCCAFCLSSMLRPYAELHRVLGETMSVEGYGTLVEKTQ